MRENIEIHTKNSKASPLRQMMNREPNPFHTSLEKYLPNPHHHLQSSPIQTLTKPNIIGLWRNFNTAASKQWLSKINRQNNSNHNFNVSIIWQLPISLILLSHIIFFYQRQKVTNTVKVYSFIDKCFPDFPNWIVQLKPKPQNTFNLKSSMSSLEDTRGTLFWPQRKSLQAQFWFWKSRASVGFLNKILKINLQNAI